MERDSRFSKGVIQPGQRFSRFAIAERRSLVNRTQAGQVVRHLHALRVHHAAIPHQRRIPAEEVIQPVQAGPTFFFGVGRFCKPSHSLTTPRSPNRGCR